MHYSFRKTKAKLGGTFIMRDKFYESFFGMSEKFSKKKIGSLAFAVNIRVYYLEAALLLPFTFRQNR